MGFIKKLFGGGKSKKPEAPKPAPAPQPERNNAGALYGAGGTAESSNVLGNTARSTFLGG